MSLNNAYRLLAGIKTTTRPARKALPNGAAPAPAGKKAPSAVAEAVAPSRKKAVPAPKKRGRIRARTPETSESESDSSESDTDDSPPPVVQRGTRTRKPVPVPLITPLGSPKRVRLGESKKHLKENDATHFRPTAENLDLSAAVAATVLNQIPPVLKPSVPLTKEAKKDSRKEMRYKVPDPSEAERLRPEIVSSMSAPTVQIQNSPFHEFISNIFHITSIRSLPVTPRGENREVTISFVTNTTAFTPNLMAIVRMAENPSRSPAPETHPMNLSLKLNENILVQPEVYKNANGQKKSPHFSPVEASLSTFAQRNTLIVAWTEEPPTIPQDFTVFVQLVRKKTVDEVNVELSRQRWDQARTMRRLYQQLSSSEDDEISSNSRIISLLCPLSRKRLVMPTRGKQCAHVECFDGKDYVQLNSSAKAKWLCPKCSLRVPFHDLVVDEFMEELLAFTQSGNVEVIADMGYLVVTETKKSTESVVIRINNESDKTIADLLEPIVII